MLTVYDNEDFKGQILKNGLKEDLSGGPNFNIEFRYNYFSDGKIFSTVEAMTLKRYVAGENFKNIKVHDPEKKRELEKLTASLRETDNPVLIVITPKEW